MRCIHVWCLLGVDALRIGRQARTHGAVVTRTLLPRRGAVLSGRRARLTDRPRPAARRAGRPSGIAARASARAPRAPRLLARRGNAPTIAAGSNADEQGGTADDRRISRPRCNARETVLQRRPDMGLHDDAPATARWDGGTRVVASHANGTRCRPTCRGELGGTGDEVTPGWLFRAGLASCAATSIAMTAAAEGIELTTLEVRVSEPLGHARAARHDGRRRHARVRRPERRSSCTSASLRRDAPPERLRALVEEGCRCSPIPAAVVNAVPLDAARRRRPRKRLTPRRWTHYRKLCASCAWSARSSSTRRFTAPWCYQSPHADSAAPRARARRRARRDLPPDHRGRVLRRDRRGSRRCG